MPLYMSMSMPMSSGDVTQAESDLACLLGDLNGTYPNGTLGGGTWMFGHYVPTSVEEGACQLLHDPWMGSPKYGHWTVGFILTAIAIFTVVGTHRRVEHLTGTRMPLTPRRVSAFWSGVSIIKVPWVPALGPTMLMLAFFVFAMGYTFGVRPYQRPPNYGSSPLGLRSEWAATAVMPFIYAFGTRVNFVGYLTNTSFVTMRAFHVWAGWFCLLMSVVHTIAMFIRANRQAPLWYTVKTNAEYVNGFWALVPLIWLTVMSLNPFKNRFYETFFVLHWLAASMFLAGMFVHCWQALDSTNYLWATTAIWSAAMIIRYGAVLLRTRVLTRLDTAAISLAGDRAVKIDVRTSARWAPGQHVFLRFGAAEPWATHPFTIASLPGDAEGMVILARSYGGVTGRLYGLASKASGGAIETRIVVDGPYGGDAFLGVRACDAAVLVAGGSGITAVLSLLKGLLEVPQGLRACTQVKLVWVVRHTADFEWFEQEIFSTLSLATGMKDIALSVELYVSDVDVEKTKGEEKADNDTESKGSVEHENRVSSLFRRCPPTYVRPNVRNVIQYVAGQTGGRLGVVACGPESMLVDARVAAVAVNLAIARGNKDLKASDVDFYSESFEM